MIRLSKLHVMDEIDNGLAYYRYTFLAELPRLYGELEAGSRAVRVGAPATRAAVPAHGFLDRRRPRRQSVRRRGDARLRDHARRRAVAFAHYLDEVHGSAASCRCRRASCSRRPSCSRWRAAAHDANPHRADEPYRQALIGIYARLAATAQALAGHVPPRAPHADLAAVRDGRATFVADLQTIAASLATHGATPLADGRLEPLQRAVEVFGFHLAALDLRQNADVHEAVVAELLARAGRRRRLRGAAGSDARVALLARELATPRPLHSPHLDVLGAHRRPSSRSSRAAADIHRRFGAGRAAELRHLEVPVGVRPARSRRCC